MAVAILSALGYDVVAVTGKIDKESDYLKKLGAAAIISRSEFEVDAKSLGKELYSGCIDTVGGLVLSNILALSKINLK